MVTKVLSPVLYRIKGKKQELVTHHDNLKICEDRSIPIWMRRLRHKFMELDPSITYDESEEEEDDQILAGLFTETEQANNDDTSASNVDDGEKANQSPACQSTDTANTSDSNDPQIQDTPVKTRTGRLVKRPKYLTNYVS